MLDPGSISITLTPSTLSADIADAGFLTIHGISVRDTELEKAKA
jgi:multisubunit Na+/H+ antiporter MnhE subunit